jgi:hypothetical protein
MALGQAFSSAITHSIKHGQEANPDNLEQPERGFRDLDNCEIMATARCDVGRSSRNAVDGVGGRRSAVGVIAPADDVTRVHLDRAAVGTASCNGTAR